MDIKVIESLPKDKAQVSIFEVQQLDEGGLKVRFGSHISCKEDVYFLATDMKIAKTRIPQLKLSLDKENKQSNCVMDSVYVMYFNLKSVSKKLAEQNLGSDIILNINGKNQGLFKINEL